MLAWLYSMRLCVIIKAGKIISGSLVDNNHQFGIHEDHYHMYCPFTDDVDCQVKESKDGPTSSRGNTATPFNATRFGDGEI